MVELPPFATISICTERQCSRTIKNARCAPRLDPCQQVLVYLRPKRQRTKLLGALEECLRALTHGFWGWPSWVKLSQLGHLLLRSSTPAPTPFNPVFCFLMLCSVYWLWNAISLYIITSRHCQPTFPFIHYNKFIEFSFSHVVISSLRVKSIIIRPLTHYHPSTNSKGQNA